MREICFCGRAGEIEDRELVSLEGGERALRCPECGHTDPVKWTSVEKHAEIFEEAAEREARRSASAA